MWTFGYFCSNCLVSSLMTGSGPGSWLSADHTLSVMSPSFPKPVVCTFCAVPPPVLALLPLFDPGVPPQPAAAVAARAQAAIAHADVRCLIDAPRVDGNGRRAFHCGRGVSTRGAECASVRRRAL